MFNFHQRLIHVSKDDAYDANNVISSIYQVLIISDLSLEWRVIVEGLGLLQKIFWEAFRILFWS